MIKYICDLCKKTLEKKEFHALDRRTIADQPIEILEGLDPAIYDVCEDCHAKIEEAREIARQQTEDVYNNILAKKLNLKAKTKDEN